MANPAGGPGRPKGCKNLRTLEVDAIASRFNLNPFEVLMMITAGDWKGLGFEAKTKTTFTAQGIEIEEDNVPLAVRCQAAKEAAQYLYPKKKALTIEPTEEQAARVIEASLQSRGIDVHAALKSLTSGSTVQNDEPV